MKSKNPLFLLLPALALIAFNSIFPTLYVLYLSFNRYFMTGKVVEMFFVGLDNYRFLFSDADFWASLYRGAIFSIICLAIEVPLGLLLAYIAKDLPRKLRTACTMIFCAPLLIPNVAVGCTWLLYTRGWFSLLPNLLNRIGIHYSLSNPVHAWWTVVAMDVWHWTGFIYLVCLAGFYATPPEYLEAVAIDRAGAWGTFKYAYWPFLKFPLFVGILIRFMDSFRIYDEVMVLTAGGPGTTTRFLSLYTVGKALTEFNVGLGSAVSLVYLYIIIAVCAIFMIGLTLGERR